MRAADLLAECLAAHGVDRIFCVPGESYLSLLDALADRPAIDLVVCRHEGGAGLMGVADARLTRRPGVVAVSRGPGATNASIAVHLAQQDALPLVLLVGQVARHERGRGAFQEVDYAAFLGSMAKMVAEVNDAGRLPETIARAFHAARSGTPGPVVIALPEDMLADDTAAQVIAPVDPAVSLPAPGLVAKAAALLGEAKRPLLIAGGALDDARGRAALARAAETHGLPVVLTFKHQEIFDNASPLYAGHLGFKIPKPQVEALSRADLVLAVGTRIGDTPSQGYNFPSAPEPAQPLIHVWPDPEVIGRVFRPTLGLSCDPAGFIEMLAEINLPEVPERAGWAAELHAIATPGYTPEARADGVEFGAVVAELARTAPHDTILTMDAGNFSSWIHRVWPWDGTQQAIGASGGAMGLGVPGAVAASLRNPGRCVLGFTGDGGALMTGSELATAVAKGAKPKIIVSANGSYGTIRLHQERDHPGRVSGTDLANPCFASWGRSFGALGIRVESPEEVADACAELLAHDGPAVMHVQASLEAIAATTTITKLRGEA